MVGIILGVVCIIGGGLWCLVVLFASSMADRTVENSEMALPIAGGLGAIALGIVLIVFG